MTDHIYSLTSEAHRSNAAKITEEISSLKDRIAELEEQRRIALAMADFIDAQRHGNPARPRAESPEIFSQDAQREVDPYETIVPESPLD